MSSHLGLDLNRVEDLAVVDANDAANHLRDDDHVAQVGLDDGGLLIGRSLLLGLAELFDEAHRAALETALEPSAGTSVDELWVSRNVMHMFACIQRQYWDVRRRTRVKRSVLSL